MSIKIVNDDILSVDRYLRGNIQYFVKLNKPVIITGIYKGSCTSSDNMNVFSNIEPYVDKKEYFTHNIANHINISKKEVNKYIKNLDMESKYILACRPYIYYDDYNIPKGSLLLTDELELYGFKPIEKYTKDKLNFIPYKEIIDFRKECNNLFAWPKDSLYNRYNKNIPNKNYVYIGSIKNETNKKLLYNTKANIKSLMRSVAKQRLYDFKHSYNDKSGYMYNYFNLD